MHLSVSKFIYPSYFANLQEKLLPFKSLSVQLAFFQRKDFLDIDHRKIKNLCNSMEIYINSIHLPTIDVFHDNFLMTLKTVREIYNVNIVTIHPQKCARETALRLLQKYSQQITEMDIILAYENFPEFTAKRKWINSVRDMYRLFELPFLKITFDTSHLDDPANALNELKSVIEKVYVVHLSDKKDNKRHLPIDYGIVPCKEIIGYLYSIKFDKLVVLEYLSKYEHQLVEDVEKYNKSHDT